MGREFARFSVKLSETFDLGEGLDGESPGVTSANFYGPGGSHTDVTNSLESLNALASNNTKYTIIDINVSSNGDSGTFMAYNTDTSFLLMSYPVNTGGSNPVWSSTGLTFGDTTVVLSKQRSFGSSAELTFTHPENMTLLCFVHSDPVGNPTFCPWLSWSTTQTIVTIPTQSAGTGSVNDQIILSFLTKPKSPAN